MGVSTFNEMEIDAIGEIMNISLGASATAVSTMLGTAVQITTPVVRVIEEKNFEFKKLRPAVGVEISYVVGLEGSNIMMFSREDVRIIVSMLMGMEIPKEQFELDDINRSAICEVMNVMMGSSATALSEFLGYTVDISTPISFEIESEEAFMRKYFPENESRVVVRFSLEVEGKLKSEFLNIMTIDLAKKLLLPFAISLTGEEPQMEQIPEPQAAQPEPPAAAQPEASSGGTLSQAEIEALMASAMQEEAPAPAPQPSSSGGNLSQAEIEALMASAAQEAAPPAPQPAAAPAPQPGSSGGILSQAEIEALMAQTAPQQAAPAPQPMAQPVQQMQPAPQMQPQYVQMAQPAMDPMMLQLLNQMQQSQMQMMEMMSNMKRGGTEPEKPRSTEPSIIHPMSSSQLDRGADAGIEDSVNQEMLLKVPLEVSVEIGRTKKLVRDILEFTQGSLVVLDKMAGEQADLYVNGQCIARGDIVVVEDNFGIRITEIVTRNLNPETL